VPPVDLFECCTLSSWLSDLVQLADLRYIDERKSIGRRTLPLASTSVPQLQDINGNAFQYLNTLSQLFEELVEHTEKMVDVDLRAITGVQTGPGQHVPFLTLSEYYRHPTCQRLINDRTTIQNCLYEAFGPERQTRFLMPRWSAAFHSQGTRMYWLNTGSAPALAIAKALALQNQRVHSVRGELEIQTLSPKVLEELLGFCTMVAVNNKYAVKMGLYELLKAVDFPVLSLHGLSPLSREAEGVVPTVPGESNKDELRRQLAATIDILIFPRASVMATFAAEMLLKENQDADFGKFLLRLARSQYARPEDYALAASR
jgi:hypothetical protein